MSVRIGRAKSECSQLQLVRVCHDVCSALQVVSDQIRLWQADTLRVRATTAVLYADFASEVSPHILLAALYFMAGKPSHLSKIPVVTYRGGKTRIHISVYVVI